MDGSKPRKSDVAATRKRRSSILKSQRSARAPLSELEFNVATPPDQAKSRRVSFSRRTGVAEFEISEATTAWKNVYEEHNKSLESSANESGMKAAPRRVAHLGGRASHFEDDEADVIDTSEPAPPPPAGGAELSELAHTHNTVQLFRLDANPALRELTDHLHVDFSAVAPLNDDLDVLRHDLEREARPANISEYSIDVDFNSTHFTLKADDDDMSITDTVRSPTVAATETKSHVDWTADKENIVVNPYIAPKASDNFEVSDEDILVFDGKKCKFQSNLDLSDEEIPSRTVVYDDVADDMSVTRVVLPARDEVNITQPGRGGQRTTLFDVDMTVTRIVPAQILSDDLSDDRKSSRTVVYDDAAADMSVTQAVARVVLPARDEVVPHPGVDQRTVFLDDDMAVTRGVPARILSSDDDRKPSTTVVYDDAAADMSVTQAVHQVVLTAREEVVACRTDQKSLLDDGMAVTRALPALFLPSEEHGDRVPDSNASRRRTVVFGNDDGDISVTQAVPSNIINAESSNIVQPEPNKQATMYDDMADMSVTQTVPADLIPEPQCRKTIVFDDDDGHISMTEAVPAGALLAARRTDSVAPALDNKPENTERRRTIVYSNEEADISMTGVVTTNIHKVAKVTDPENLDSRETIDAAAINKHQEKEASEVLNADCMSMVSDRNISVTQALPSNIIDAMSPEIIQQEPNKQKTLYFEDMADMSVTQAVPADLIQDPQRRESQRRKTIVFDDDDGHISMTEAVPAGALLAALRRDSWVPALDNKPENTDRRKTIMYNNEDANISITGVVTADIHIAKLTEPHKGSPEIVGSDIYSYVDSMKPQVSPGSSPAMSRNSPNASFDAMFSSPKRDSPGSKASVVVPGSPHASILDALLDMSQASVEALAIEYVPQVKAQESASNTTITNTAPSSNTTISNIVPTSESYMEVQDDEQVEKATKEIISEHPSGMEDIPERPAIEGSAPLPIEYKKEKHGIVCKLQHKLSELKDHLTFKDRTSPKKGHARDITCSRHSEDEKISSVHTPTAPPESSVDLGNQSQINNSDLKSASPEHDKTAKQEKNKSLTINMSSRIHESIHDNESSLEQEKNAILTTSEDCEEPEQKEQSQWTAPADDTRAILDALSDFTDTRRSGDFEVEHKPVHSPDKSRRSSAPDRKSMMISREDLLREISMAQAIMKTEMQQTEELTEASSDEHEVTPPRLSGEVVKTLRFEDDESILEPRVLHKPAVAAASPPRRAPAVIPAYDVSDHVKELVHDLIKPMTDVLPQCMPDFTRTEPSRGSQVDNLESSQIDLIPSKPVLIEPRRASCLRRSPERVAQHSEMQVDQKSSPPSYPPCKPVTPEPRAPAVIVFDHFNPLNNVLLPPVDQTVVHKYNPRLSDESLNPSLDSQSVQTEAQTPRARSVECGVVLLAATVDRAVASERHVRDSEANTSIVMKANRELLAASSSLTLVDDALARSAFDVTELMPRSPVRVIFKLDEPHSSVKLDSELTSCDSSDFNRQKRGHIASKGPEVTPKPAIKVQKVSDSSKVVRRMRSLSPTEKDTATSLSSDSRSSAVTVSRAALRSRAAAADWRPELLHEPSSKNLACEQDPGVNVVAKIDVLPFMGTSECEWESRAADTWSFRLLRGRLRLLVRLEHRACNTTRAAVRADTPVRLVLVQHARRDADYDPVAALCLCLAAEALQRVAARGCARAGAVPGLLRRCAALARVALRWGRAMRAARAELAFSLAEDGLLSLKVANIPLRSVWEVTLRVELAAGGGGLPWPRAVAPRVTRVVAAWAPAPLELERVLDTVPEDWGHVPRTVWKIFKYLKNKRPEDDLLTA